MTPPRAAALILMVLIPAGLWGFVNTLRSDLATRTRAVLWQAQHGDAGTPRRLCERFRDPQGTPAQQEVLFNRLWRALREVRAAKVEYGAGQPMAAADGQLHDHRQVIIQGKGGDGEPLTVRLEWVRCRSGWCLVDCSGAPAGTDHKTSF